MATRNLVPRANNEGAFGQSDGKVFESLSYYGNAEPNRYVKGFGFKPDLVISPSIGGEGEWKLQQSEIASGNSIYHRGISIDSSGNYYVRGDIVVSGTGKHYVAKFNSSGTLQWHKTFKPSGSTGNADHGFEVSSISGDVYVTGVYSTDGTESGNRSVLTKYNSSGVLQWAKSFYINSQNSNSKNISFDASGNIYVICNVLAGDNRYDAHIVKYNSSGVLQWQRVFSVTGVDFFISEIKLDSSNNIYVSGYTGNPRRGIIMKLNSTATSITWYHTYYSGSHVQGLSILLDSSNNVYVQDRGSYTNDITLLKYDVDGNLQWQRKIDSGISDESPGMCLDSDANIYILFKKFITKHNSSGVLQWSKELTNNASEFTSNPVVDNTNKYVYVSGRHSYRGTQQIYIARLDLNGLSKDHINGFSLANYTVTETAGTLSLDSSPTSPSNNSGSLIDSTLSGTETTESFTYSSAYVYGDGGSNILITDSLRGATKSFANINSSAEQSNNEYTLQKYDDDGFITQPLLNQSNYVNYASSTKQNRFNPFAWKAEQVNGSNEKYSTKSGLSIVTYTGTGANMQINHSLGVTPKFMIIKKRNASGTSWAVYNNNIGATKALLLDTTSAQITDSTYFNNTEPTSLVFHLGTNGAVNASGDTYVAYIFSEVPGVNKFTTYTGNTSTRPTVTCGFTPKLVWAKRTDNTSNWFCWYKIGSVYYRYHLNTATHVSIQQDEISFTSTGFTFGRDGDFNVNGASYIVMSFGDGLESSNEKKWDNLYSTNINSQLTTDYVTNSNAITVMDEDLVFYLSPTGDDTNGDGSIGKPWKTMIPFDQRYRYTWFTPTIASTIAHRSKRIVQGYVLSGSWNLGDFQWNNPTVMFKLNGQGISNTICNRESGSNSWKFTGRVYSEIRSLKYIGNNRNESRNSFDLCTNSMVYFSDVSIASAYIGIQCLYNSFSYFVSNSESPGISDCTYALSDAYESLSYIYVPNHSFSSGLTYLTQFNGILFLGRLNTSGNVETNRGGFIGYNNDYFTASSSIPSSNTYTVDTIFGKGGSCVIRGNEEF